MRRILLLGLAIAVAACAPVQEKPEPPPVAKAPRVKPRFDPLAMLEQDTKPERDGIRDKHRYDRSIGATSVDGLKYFFYEPGGKRTVVGFSFLNDGSPTINPAGLKRRLNRAFKMVPPRRSKKQYLRFSRPSVRIAFQHQTADFFGPRAAARFPRQDNIMSGRAQMIGEKPGLRGFTRSVDTLKCDEHRAGQLPTSAITRAENS